MEIIIEILAEVFIQILFELGSHSLIEPFRRKPTAGWALVGYIFFGALAGAVSCVFFKELLVKETSYQILNLFVTPMASGYIMAVLGKMREKKGLELIRMDKFAYGFAFAFSMALVRFFILK